jgi:cytoskeletal protein CcmA (bactofilin family)
MIWKRKRGAVETTDGAAARKAGPDEVNSDALEPGAVTGAALGRANPINSDKLLSSGGRLELGFKPLPEAVATTRKYSIPRAYRVSGRLVSARPISVQGDVSGGELSAQVVSVMPGGRVGARTKAETVQVAGLVSGDIRAKALVDVSSIGELTGSVEAPQVRVLPGAKLVGASLKVIPGA